MLRILLFLAATTAPIAAQADKYAVADALYHQALQESVVETYVGALDCAARFMATDETGQSAHLVTAFLAQGLAAQQNIPNGTANVQSALVAVSAKTAVIQSASFNNGVLRTLKAQQMECLHMLVAK